MVIWDNPFFDYQNSQMSYGILQLYPTSMSMQGLTWIYSCGKGHHLSAPIKNALVCPNLSKLTSDKPNVAHPQQNILTLNRSMKYRTFCIEIRSIASAAKNSNPVKKLYFGQLGDSYRSSRCVVARADTVQNGIPDSGYPHPGSSEVNQWGKVRGVLFYTATAVTAIFLFVLMVVGHPLVLLFDPYRRRFHHFIAKFWASLTIAPFFKVEYVGLENLPQSDAPAVYISNHQSFLDIYTLLTLGRSFKFISKTSIFLYPIIGWAMFLMGVIPLKRMDSRSQLRLCKLVLECLKRCTALIKKGASVFYFPEGTRSKDGKLGVFKKGAFSVAVKTGAPVVPITLQGTGNIMPPSKEGLVNPGSVRVVIHKPLVGDNAEVLCKEARKVISQTLNSRD